MNLTTWNDPFIAGLNAGIFPNKEIAESFRKALQAPLFIHDLGSDQWNAKDFPYVFDEKRLPRLPFSSFRAHLTDYKKMGIASEVETDPRPMTRKEMLDYNEFVSRVQPGTKPLEAGKLYPLSIDMIVVRTEGDGECSRFITWLWRFHSGTLVPRDYGSVIFATAEVSHDLELVSVTYDCKMRKFIGQSAMTETGRLYLPKFMKMSNEFLLKFCIDWMNPHFFPAKVQPKKDGKSIQWLEPRTHYVLVHKSRGIKKAAGVRPPTPGEELQRMAHSRRAHWRLLRSSVFRHKQGTYVPVKECWVGPEEWEGDSGQIYKMCRDWADARFYRKDQN